MLSWVHYTGAGTAGGHKSQAAYGGISRALQHYQQHWFCRRERCKAGGSSILAPQCWEQAKCSRVGISIKSHERSRHKAAEVKPGEQRKLRDNKDARLQNTHGGNTQTWSGACFRESCVRQLRQSWRDGVNKHLGAQLILLQVQVDGYGVSGLDVLPDTFESCFDYSSLFAQASALEWECLLLCIETLS